jgi:hypothetical protein
VGVNTISNLWGELLKFYLKYFNISNKIKRYLYFLKITIASIAKNVHMLHSHVAWSMAALEAAKAEGKPRNFIAKIKKIISQGQMEHDEVSNISCLITL